MSIHLSIHRHLSDLSLYVSLCHVYRPRRLELNFSRPTTEQCPPSITVDPVSIALGSHSRRCLEAAQLLKHEATKVALAFNDGPETVEHNTEIINDFVKVAVLLAGFVREGCVGKHAGPTLVKALSDYVSQVMNEDV